MESFNLLEIINKTLYIVGPVLKNKNVDYEIKCDNNIDMNGYPNDLLQALLNIVNNAKDVLIEKEHMIKIIRLNV